MARRRPTPAELAANPRARSAVLRVAERSGGGGMSARCCWACWCWPTSPAMAWSCARHRHRQLFVELTRLERARDELNIEFGRLQLEQATWAESNRVDQVARDAPGHGVPAHRRHRGAAPMKLFGKHLHRPAPGWRASRARDPPRATGRRATQFNLRGRLMLVCGTLGLCSVALVARALDLQLVDQRFLPAAGRCALRARNPDRDLARHDHRPQRRAAGGVLAGRIGVGQSRRNC
jgi:hypothetical protein